MKNQYSKNTCQNFLNQLVFPIQLKVSETSYDFLAKRASNDFKTASLIYRLGNRISWSKCVSSCLLVWKKILEKVWNFVMYCIEYILLNHKFPII